MKKLKFSNPIQKNIEKYSPLENANFILKKTSLQNFNI